MASALIAAAVVVGGTVVWIGLCLYKDLFGEQS
jgi:hypothetical protein